MIPEEMKYTEEHEWVKLEDGVATIGITDHATEELGEIVFVELPKKETEYSQMDEFGTIESVKTVSSLFAPISGTVVDINEILTNQPEQVNDSPYSNGWILKIKASDENEFDDLMTPEEYTTYIETL